MRRQYAEKLSIRQTNIIKDKIENRILFWMQFNLYVRLKCITLNKILTYTFHQLNHQHKHLRTCL